ncbi:fatty acid synthase-like [Vespula squamosa]|uniref:Fatty acid synthase-like n=1 Tax=Vespula squamosa TaxID=30214 RepID=A0ABD2A5N6_VESSQ
MNSSLNTVSGLRITSARMLNQDDHCKVFDEDANGYTRSESIFVVFLQKAKTAKRIYATIIHAKTNCNGYKDEGIIFPSNLMQSTLLKEFYEECSVSTFCISYIKIHDHIFTKTKTNSLKIGYMGKILKRYGLLTNREKNSIRKLVKSIKNEAFFILCKRIILGTVKTKQIKFHKIP